MRKMTKFSSYFGEMSQRKKTQNLDAVYIIMESFGATITKNRNFFLEYWLYQKSK